jgi:hypothetical protein
MHLILSRLSALCAIVAFSSLSLTTFMPACGGYVVVMGDATPTFALQYDSYDGHEGNRAFFGNLLGGGDSVLLLERSHGNADLVNDFYNETRPGTSRRSSAPITETLLQGVDLLVASRVIRDFSASEVHAISGLLARGGSLLVIVEPPGADDAEPVRATAHALLDRFHLNIRLLNPLFDVGSNVATGDQIAKHPLTNGVTTLNYGWAANVQGGTPLFFGSTGRPFTAAAFVPEPSTSGIASTCVIAVLSACHRRRFRI